jgi:tRNA/tmRNA/rRNA uracil-C5-methylase (TrmA/RlmC/RlmD family)
MHANVCPTAKRHHRADAFHVTFPDQLRHKRKPVQDLLRRKQKPVQDLLRRKRKPVQDLLRRKRKPVLPWDRLRHKRIHLLQMLQPFSKSHSL